MKTTNDWMNENGLSNLPGSAGSLERETGAGLEKTFVERVGDIMGELRGVVTPRWELAERLETLFKDMQEAGAALREKHAEELAARDWGIERLKAQRAGYGDRLAASENEVRELRASIGRWQVAKEEAQSKVAALERERGDFRSALGEAGRNLNEVMGRLNCVLARAERAEAEVKAITGERNRHFVRCVELQNERNEMRQKAEDAERGWKECMGQRDGLEGRLSDARAQAQVDGGNYLRMEKRYQAMEKNWKLVAHKLGALRQAVGVILAQAYSESTAEMFDRHAAAVADAGGKVLASPEGELQGVMWSV